MARAPQAAQRSQSPRQARGLTLVEMAAVLCICSVLLGSWAPELTRLRSRTQLESVAASLRTDLQLARSSATALGQPVQFSAHADDRGSCYVVHAGPPDGCTCRAAEAPRCASGSQLLRSASLSAAQPVQLALNARSMRFDPVLGTVTPTGTFDLRSADGLRLHVVVNVMGRVRQCRADGSASAYAPSC